MRRLLLPLLAVCAGFVSAAPAAGSVSVLRGKHYGERIFPDDAFTVRDSAQLTGRRLNFRIGVDFPTVAGRVARRCTGVDYSLCDGFAELNRLDGFDIQPRVVVPLSGPIRLGSVNDSDLYISDARGGFATGLRQITFDPVTHVLSGIADRQLLEGAAYRIHVTSGIRDGSGRPIRACGGTCVVRFTTRSASADLVHIRQSLDLPASKPASAYALAGIADRKLSFTQGGVDDVFPAASVLPSLIAPTNGIVRTDQVKSDPGAAGAFKSSTVPNLIPPGTVGYYAFGSFLSPRYQYASASAHEDSPYALARSATRAPRCRARRRRARRRRRSRPVFTAARCPRARPSATGSQLTDGEIPAVPSGRTPRPFGADRLGAIVVTPDPARFPPPWPAAVYGPGFTRSKYDLFVSADYNASLGILTVATDPAGHGYGPQSTTTVTHLGVPTTFLSYGRGRDLNGDGVIGDGLDDGVGPTGHVQSNGHELPSHKPLDGLASGLRQTTVDDMALGRALAAGLDIPGVGTGLVDPSRIYYYGISFGGIYGTMLSGTDPLFRRALMNVPGGPIADIARLSSFRSDLASQLARARPSFLNGGPGLDGFTEDLPLHGEPPRVITHPGASSIQELLGQSNWYERSGSPETFAPRIRLRPDPAWAASPKDVAFQTAYGDGTVPNPTAGTLYRAGALFDRVTYYRNDKTPTYSSDPHGWLADPTLAGRDFGQQQLAAFLSTGQLTNPNPAWLEVPIANPANLECLHYPDPQTGRGQTRQPFPASGDC